MKKIGYGKEYKYAHSFENNFIDLEFLPDKISGTCLYTPQTTVKEKEILAFLAQRWKGKYGYK
jgi:putative ATPase